MNDEFRRNKAVGLGYNIDSGEMPERLNGTVSKIVCGVKLTEGSNPSLSVFQQPGAGPAQQAGVNPARSGRKQR